VTALKLRQAAMLGLFMTAIVCGCSSGGGDPLSDPPANVYGTGSRVHELLGEASWYDQADADAVNCAYPKDRAVNVSGVTITAIDRFDETGDGARGNYIVQDSLLEPLPFSGITVFEPTFSPPDLRLVEGDVVDVFGLLTEFPGPSGFPFSYCKTLPEITGAMELRFEGGSVKPTPIKISQLASYPEARPLMGMLVQVENVILFEDPYEDSAGRYSVRLDVGGGVLEQALPPITNELFDLKNDGPELKKGAVLKRVTGVVTFFFNMHIAPRTAADIEP